MINNLIHKLNLKKITYILLFFIFVFLVYFFTSPGRTPYDYFTRLGSNFLEGKYWIGENPPWLNELIPGGDGKFYIVYPPMPAILSMPFLILFGKNFPQQIIAHFLGAGITLLSIKLCFIITKDTKKAIWIGLLVAFGNILWFLASNGSSWFLGQVTACFFTTAALVEAFFKKRPFVIGLFLGAAYLSRIHLIITGPFFLFLVSKKINYKNIIKLILGISPFLIFNSIYNFLRFGVLWDIGYKLIPGVLNEPWYQKGLIHPSYIQNHLKIIFTAGPKILKNKPFIQPSWGGLAIWITTPAVIYSLFASLKDKVVRLSWVMILLLSLIIFSHGGTGFIQFGYRYAFDFYPFLFLLIIKSLEKRKLRWHHWILLIISIVVNAWGVLWINKFNWVSF